MTDFAPKPDANGVRWYGVHYRKRPENKECCIAAVRERDSQWPNYNQCSRSRGHGPDGLYCKTHDPAIVQARREKSNREGADKWKQTTWNDFRARIYYRNILQQIADGHNDPRALAIEALAKTYKDD